MNITLKITMPVLVALINANCPTVHAHIAGCWEDYGAKMWWNTIIIEGKFDHDHSYQALSPREHKRLEDGFFTIEEAQDFIDKINLRGW